MKPLTLKPQDPRRYPKLKPKGAPSKDPLSKTNFSPFVGLLELEANRSSFPQNGVRKKGKLASKKQQVKILRMVFGSSEGKIAWEEG